MSISEVSAVIESEPAIYEMLKYCPYEILNKFKIRNYKKGEFVLHQGEVYDHFYIIVSGLCNIYSMSESSKKYLLRVYEKGFYIGELEIFDQLPFISYVEGTTDVRLLELKRDDFIKWMSIDKNISDYIIKNLCRQTYVLCEKVGNNALYTLKQRVCRYLIKAVKRERAVDRPKLKIRTESLSEEMAVTQRSINRILHTLKKQEMIEIEGSFIIVKDINALMLAAKNN